MSCATAKVLPPNGFCPLSRGRVRRRGGRCYSTDSVVPSEIAAPAVRPEQLSNIAASAVRPYLMSESAAPAVKDADAADDPRYGQLVTPARGFGAGHRFTAGVGAGVVDPLWHRSVLRDRMHRLGVVLLTTLSE